MTDSMILLVISKQLLLLLGTRYNVQSSFIIKALKLPATFDSLYIKFFKFASNLNGRIGFYSNFVHLRERPLSISR